MMDMAPEVRNAYEYTKVIFNLITCLHYQFAPGKLTFSYYMFYASLFQVSLLHTIQYTHPFIIVSCSNTGVIKVSKDQP